MLPACAASTATQTKRAKTQAQQIWLPRSTPHIPKSLSLLLHSACRHSAALFLLLLELAVRSATLVDVFGCTALYNVLQAWPSYKLKLLQTQRSKCQLPLGPPYCNKLLLLLFLSASLLEHNSALYSGVASRLRAFDVRAGTSQSSSTARVRTHHPWLKGCCWTVCAFSLEQALHVTLVLFPVVL